ncbi:MAG: hypothetical protein ACOC4C_03290 [Fibrobacterota bacterium]
MNQMIISVRFSFQRIVIIEVSVSCRNSHLKRVVNAPFSMYVHSVIPARFYICDAQDGGIRLDPSFPSIVE